MTEQNALPVEENDLDTAVETATAPEAAAAAPDAAVATETAATPEPETEAVEPEAEANAAADSTEAATAADPDSPAAITFADLGLSDDALKAVSKLGYDTPTPVQAQAIPVVLEGSDVIAAASTGTGKTAAFLLPLLSNLARAGRGKRPPRVLVVTPTRELAQQIAFTCIKIARATGHFATTVYGGTPYGPQIRELRGGTDILIATPGRLNDLMERGVVDLSAIEALVLDEADRMLDMGFLPDVTKIVEKLPTERQTLLFSATIDQSIENNLGSLLVDPVVIQIAHRGETAKTVDQYIMPIQHKKKFELLEAVLTEKGHERVIVFARTKLRAEEVSEELVKAGYAAESIHSDKTQGRRRRALENFRKGRTDILVATDVLARGIDVTGVDYVINYDLPDMSEDYVHRIGRTGRAGERGFAISFVSKTSLKLLTEIEKLIDREIPVMELENYELDMSILRKRGKQDAGKGEKKASTRTRTRAARDERRGKGEKRGKDERNPFGEKTRKHARRDDARDEKRMRRDDVRAAREADEDENPFRTQGELRGERRGTGRRGDNRKGAGRGGKRQRDERSSRGGRDERGGRKARFERTFDERGAGKRAGRGKKRAESAYTPHAKHGDSRRGGKTRFADDTPQRQKRSKRGNVNPNGVRAFGERRGHRNRNKYTEID